MIAMAGRPGVRSVARQLHFDVHGTADAVTSGGASFVTVVQAADFPDCDHVTLSDVSFAKTTAGLLGGHCDCLEGWSPDERDPMAHQAGWFASARPHVCGA